MLCSAFSPPREKEGRRESSWLPDSYLPAGQAVRRLSGCSVSAASKWQQGHSCSVDSCAFGPLSPGAACRLPCSCCCVLSGAYCTVSLPGQPLLRQSGLQGVLSLLPLGDNKGRVTAIADSAVSCPIHLYCLRRLAGNYAYTTLRDCCSINSPKPKTTGSTPGCCSWYNSNRLTDML